MAKRERPTTPGILVEEVEGHVFVSCRSCGSDVDWEDCERCGGEGVSHHDCGEDTCACLDPEENVTCVPCEGRGGWYRCSHCKTTLAPPSEARDG